MKRLLLAFLFFLFFVTSAFAVNYPQHQNYVNDFNNVISQPTEDALNKKLAEYDKRTTNQIAVVTINTTKPETIEEYSIKLTDRWKIGQKGKDNGVLLLFAMDDRTMRIEVGRGLEGEFTDLTSKQILDTIIRPEFRNGNFDSGIQKGVDAIIGVLEKTVTIAPTANGTDNLSTMDIFIIVIMIIIVITIIIAISPYTPLGGQGTWGPTTVWGRSNNKHSSGGFGGFGGGGFSGGGSSSRW